MTNCEIKYFFTCLRVKIMILSLMTGCFVSKEAMFLSVYTSFLAYLSLCRGLKLTTGTYTKVRAIIYIREVYIYYYLSTYRHIHYIYMYTVLTLHLYNLTNKPKNSCIHSQKINTQMTKSP